jgi:hypothetical protein
MTELEGINLDYKIWFTNEDEQTRYSAIQNYCLRVNKPLLQRLQYLFSRRRVPLVVTHGTGPLPLQ